MKELNIIGRFEAIRHVLNHSAVYPLDDLMLDCAITRPLPTRETFMEALAEYDADLRENIFPTVNDPDYPAPVLPVVDVARGTITHTTCTGNTHITVDWPGTNVAPSIAVARVWQNTVRDRALRAFADDSFSYMGFYTMLFFSPEELRAFRFTVPDGRLLARVHGVFALYRSFDCETLYADGECYRDYEDDLGEPAWMSKAPDHIRERVIGHLRVLGILEAY